MCVLHRGGRGRAPGAGAAVRAVPARDPRLHLYREQRHLHAALPPAADIDQVCTALCFIFIKLMIIFSHFGGIFKDIFTSI